MSPATACDWTIGSIDEEAGTNDRLPTMRISAAPSCEQAEDMWQPVSPSRV